MHLESIDILYDIADAKGSSRRRRAASTRLPPRPYTPASRRLRPSVPISGASGRLHRVRAGARVRVYVV